MAFAQLTYRERLRDIQACLRGEINKLHHRGNLRKASLSALAEAREVSKYTKRVLIIEAEKEDRL